MIIDYFKNEDKLVLFVYFFIVTTPWYFINSQFSFFSILLLIFCFFKYKNEMRVTKIYNVKNYKPLIVLYLFFIYTYLSLLWTSNLEHGLWAQKVFRESIVFIPLLMISLEYRHVKVIINLFLLSIGLYAIYTIGIYLEAYILLDTKKINPKGHLTYMTLSHMLVISILISSVLIYFSKEKYLKYFYGTIIFVSTISLFINNSRSLKLTLVLTIFTFLLFYGKKFIKLRTIIIAFGLFIIVISLMLKDNNRFNKGLSEIKKTSSDKIYKGSWGHRIYMYKTGLTIFKANLLFGVGAGDSKDEYRKIAEKEVKNKKLINFKHLHNQHIEYLVRYGALGYFLFLTAIVYLLYSIRKNSEYFYIGVLFFMTIFYNGLFNSVIDKKPINIIVFIFFALLSLVAYHESSKVKEQKID